MVRDGITIIQNWEKILLTRPRGELEPCIGAGELAPAHCWPIADGTSCGADDTGSEISRHGPVDAYPHEHVHQTGFAG